MSILGSNTGGTANNNNWGSSTGFGKQSTIGGTNNGSLFGNSTSNSNNSNSTGGLFGNMNTSSTGGGLFGNTNKIETGSGLFGNSANNTNSSTPTNLFGSSTTNNTTSTGLFGSSTNKNTQASGGLFGPSAQNNTSSGGLFGSSTNNPTSIGPSSFGSSSSGGLFGNSSTNKTTAFGNQNAPSSGGLLGNAETSSIGDLFGAKQQQSGSLFGHPNNQTNIQRISDNPYNYDQAFVNLQNALDGMPRSITENIITDNNIKVSSERKRRFSYLEKPSEESKPKSSLLRKLSQSFKFFRNSTSPATDLSYIKGLFKQSNRLSSKDAQNILPKSATLAPKRIIKQSYRSDIDVRNMGSVKRLVIKSKPLKFHLIDADKVFNAKRRRIMTDFVSSDKLLTENYSSDEESEDEIFLKSKDQKPAPRFPYKSKVGENLTTENPQKANKIINGESVNTNESTDDDPDNREVNNGYWCAPSIKELSKLSIEQLTAVGNFIVGRAGYGQIAYNYPVDLSKLAIRAKQDGTALNKVIFDKVIKIRHKSIEVYGDEENKPPIGFGLNVPATITLERIVPKEGTSPSDYIKFLQCQVGMEFVTYDPITCIWVFKVKHFSVWGLIEEDENNSEQSRSLVELKRKQDAKEAEAVLEYSRIYENDKFSQELKKQKLSHDTNILPGGWTYNNTTQESPLNIKRGLVTEEINSQLDLFKQQQVANGLSSQVSDITIDSSDSCSSMSPETDFGGSVPLSSENKNFEYLKQLVSFLPKNVNMSDIIDEKAYEPEITNEAIFDNIQIRPNLAVSDDWLIQLELANDINSSLTPFITETPKQSKVTIENVDEILFSDFNKASANKNQISTPINDHESHDVDDIEFDSYEEIYPQSILKVVYHLLPKSKISRRTNNYPIVERSDNLSFNDLLISEWSAEEDQLIKLGSSLFDEHDLSDEYSDIDKSNTKLIEYLKDLQQRKLFAQWLKSYNKQTIEELTKRYKSDSLDLVFVNVCAGDLKGAISTAINSNNSHLSVILTLTDSNDDAVKSIAKNQLSSWTENSVFNLIPESIVKVYQILAGEFDDIIIDLPWNIALALKLFYGDNTITLKELIKDFHDTIVTLKESRKDFQNSIEDTCPVTDILQLYDQIQSLGKSAALRVIGSSKLNIKLKWFFNKILTQNIEGDESIGDELSLAFGIYLEKNRLWKEALFVYSHLSNDKQAESVIRDVVISNVNKIKDLSKNIDEEEFLIKVLRVPHDLIYEAISVNKRSAGDYWGECEALVTAKLWDKAHETIVNEIGPSTVISNSDVSRDHLLNIISKFPDGGMIIPGWIQGAGIYEHYIKLSRNSNIDTVSSLDFLLSNIPLIKQCHSFQSQVALKLMSKRVGDIALANTAHIKDIKEKILSLHLGESEANYFNIRLQNVLQ